MSELNQLLLDFDYKTNFNEHDFYLSKSNSNAFNLINRWPDWDKKILNISGEKFSGKSHLANCLLYTSPSPRDLQGSRMPSSA